MRVLVTGGAGYIGSHMVRALELGGHHVVVVDDLSSGHADAVPKGVPFIRCDVRDRGAVSHAIQTHEVTAIFHFASRIQVGESVRDPRLYYRDNLAAGVELLDIALDAGVKRLILSSTAAVYGNPIRTPIGEEHATAPVNPYGATKLALEGMLASYAAAYGFSYAALRYFNAAGADDGLDGTSEASPRRGPHLDGTSEASPRRGPHLEERHHPETHLIPLVLDAASGALPSITVFGDDYDTPDGTCIRDYVHVSDLCAAHLRALEYLEGGGESGAFNLGTGKGHSVREVIACVARTTGKMVPTLKGERRAGDPPVLVASAERAKRVLGWEAKRSSLEEIVRDAWKARTGRASVQNR